MIPEVPHVVYILWLQGWADAPALVRSCRDSWVRMNPDWDVRCLSADDVMHIPNVARLRENFPAACSDVVRAELLRDGGVWADATTYCTAPLSSWLLPRVRTGFFAFSSPGYGRMLSTWFLAAVPGDAVMGRWADAVQQYWDGRASPGDYFWFHEAFAAVYRKDPTFRRQWDATPTISAAGPHYFAPYARRYAGPVSRRVRARLASGRDPVYKLTNRPRRVPTSDSAYAYFVAGGPSLPSRPVLARADHGAISARHALKTWVNLGRARVAAAGRGQKE